MGKTLARNGAARGVLDIEGPPNFLPSRFQLNRRYVTILMACYGVTQAEIARLSGTHFVTVNRVIRNRKKVRPEKRQAVLRALSERLKVEPLELCRGRAAA
jgi:hypothetical protein